MDEVIQALGKFLQADIPIAIVACGITFLVAAFLPPPAMPNGDKARWFMVGERYKYIPLALSFLLGVALGIFLDLDAKELLVSKVRGGLQTGFMSVGLYYPVTMFLHKFFGAVSDTKPGG